ncbi:hypothetical protein EVAR_17912_1 [Eumeta japonica]|uniref:FLYWCH-type domain-containing protein n=1 Tax=Eumeta variegata TaxID=151549 RepID=A0A4C1UY47_EUMVA|nr:hypothetical protein EVAR_17912_1 [Eumeta japonica]
MLTNAATNELYAFYVESQKGKPLIEYEKYTFYKHSQSKFKTRWACSTHYLKGCRARILTVGETLMSVKNEHTHPPSKHLNRRQSEVVEEEIISDDFEY